MPICWFQVKSSCLCQYGLEVSKEYTRDVIQALREGEADYEGCKESEGTKAAVQQGARATRTMFVGLLLLILSVNVAVLIVAIVMCRRQWAFRPQPSISVDRPLTTPQIISRYNPPPYSALEENTASTIALSQQA